ncbi:hypothetical protein JW948_19370 [bacterium]|nr:hypothetical protein [bacterium]
MVETMEIVDLKGVITVTDSDRKGKPLEIGIETDDFQTFVITCRKRGTELFDHIARKVTLHCRLEGKNYYGNPLISILDYSLDE